MARALDVFPELDQPPIGEGRIASVRLLVADSDADQMAMEVGWLRTRGYEVKYALSPEHIRSLWVEYHPDLAIIEPTIAGSDMLGLCRELQFTHDALVLAVASEQDAGTHIRCLESGADAYLPKPFLPAMLLAHIHALSRRVRNTLQRQPSSILTVGPISVDLLRHELSVEGELKRLTPTESKILYLLAANAANVCTLGQIVAHVWGYLDKADTMLVKAHIRHLREKIECDPSNPHHIVTIPGSGYMLVPHGVQVASDSASSAVSEPAERAIRDMDRDVPLVPSQRSGIAGKAGGVAREPGWHLPLHDVDVNYEVRVNTDTEQQAPPRR